MVGAVLKVRTAVRRAGGARAVVLAVTAAAAMAGCTHATCADYHEPGCWTPPPEGGDDGAGDASDATSDAVDEANPDGGAGLADATDEPGDD
jgi:hypothetical protein